MAATTRNSASRCEAHNGLAIPFPSQHWTTSWPGCVLVLGATSLARSIDQVELQVGVCTFGSAKTNLPRGLCTWNQQGVEKEPGCPLLARFSGTKPQAINQRIDAEIEIVDAPKLVEVRHDLGDGGLYVNAVPRHIVQCHLIPPK